VENKSSVAPFITPYRYLVYSLQENILKSQVWGLSEHPEQGMIFELPTPDGNFRGFKLWQSPVMEEGLSMKYPQIKMVT